MLRALRIQNFALIEDLKVEWSPGLNVLTGETGAGKSIIIGALSLLLGEKADPDAIRTGKDYALVEAVFDSIPGTDAVLSELALEGEDGRQLGIRRRVVRAGKGNQLVNDHATSTAVLKQLGDVLVDLHGQHEHQSLLRRELHLTLLDEFAGLAPARSRLGRGFDQYQELAKEVDSLRREMDEKRKRRDLTQAEYGELNSAALEPDEVAELSREKALLENCGKRHESATKLVALLSENEGSIIEQLAVAERELESLAELDPKLKAKKADLKHAASLLDELWRMLAKYQASVEFTPGRLEEINERLFLLQKLVRRYCPASAELDCASVKELIALRDQREKELSSLELDETRILELEQERTGRLRQLVKDARQLSISRTKARERFEQKLGREFAALGLGKARVEVSQSRVQEDDGIYEENGKRYRLNRDGVDDVEFLFSANPGEDLKPLRKIASGGELSRIMLALKSVLTDSDPVPVLVFDEIDVGISGRIAEAVGEKLQQLGRKKQVICITHLPQIARFAAAHFRVSKETRAGRTATGIERLSEPERVAEIARLLAGKEVTRTALAHAQEMLGSERD